jgi:hypothetical protein
LPAADRRRRDGNHRHVVRATAAEGIAAAERQAAVDATYAKCPDAEEGKNAD